MAHIEDSFKAALNRITCPDGATLGNYHLGLLSAEAAAPIQQHLSICPLCQQELEQLETFMAETAVSLQPSTAERIKVWIAKRIPSRGSSGNGLGMPAFAVRGKESGPQMYEAGDAQLSLEVQDDPEHPGRKVVYGLVLGIETDDIEVRLLEPDGRETAVPLDDLGNFALNNLSKGQFALILSGPTVEIHVPEIKIE